MAAADRLESHTSSFFQGRLGQIEREDLLAQWQQFKFTPAMERESEQMQAIRNLVTYARPASGSVHEVSLKENRSRFAYVYWELFKSRFR